MIKLTLTVSDAANELVLVDYAKSRYASDCSNAIDALYAQAKMYYRDVFSQYLVDVSYDKVTDEDRNTLDTDTLVLIENYDRLSDEFFVSTIARLFADTCYVKLDIEDVTDVEEVASVAHMMIAYRDAHSDRSERNN
jgi:hypothetical protein